MEHEASGSEHAYNAIRVVRYALQHTTDDGVNMTCGKCLHHSAADRCCALDGSSKGKSHKACCNFTDGKVDHGKKKCDKVGG